MNIRIEFDGGTSCNIPRLGYGNGYGSYKIDNEPVYRCFFNRPMSANAAEILTLVHAINTIRSRDFPVGQIRISIYGDSQIALRLASSFGPNSIAKKPRKISAKSTDIFRESHPLSSCFRVLRTFTLNGDPEHSLSLCSATNRISLRGYMLGGSRGG